MMPSRIYHLLIFLAKLLLPIVLYGLTQALLINLLGSNLAAYEGFHSLPHHHGINFLYAVKLMTWILLMYPYGHLAWYLLYKISSGAAASQTGSMSTASVTNEILLYHIRGLEIKLSELVKPSELIEAMDQLQNNFDGQGSQIEDLQERVQDLEDEALTVVHREW